jgi:flagellar basal body-associated protein FliL
MSSKVNNAETQKQSSKGLWIGLILCFILSVAASSGVTYFLMQPKEVEATLSDKDNEQDTVLLSLKASTAQQNSLLAELKSQNDVLKLYLRHSSSTALKNILINQEENIQAYLTLMKSAMADLSTIVQGAADWDNKYQYQLDIAQKRSIEREDLLRLLKTGEPNDRTSP